MAAHICSDCAHQASTKCSWCHKMICMAHEGPNRLNNEEGRKTCLDCSDWIATCRALSISPWGWPQSGTVGLATCCGFLCCVPTLCGSVALAQRYRIQSYYEWMST